MAIRWPCAEDTAHNVIVEKRAVATERAVLALVVIGGSGLLLLHLATGLFGVADYRVTDWAVVAGVVILVPAYWLFWRGHADLGRNWSPATEVHSEQGLVTSGVYTHIRHPKYAAPWLMFLVQPRLLHNRIAGFAGPLAFAVMYVIRLPYEEAMMRDRFGGGYDTYSARTGCLWPPLGRYGQTMTVIRPLGLPSGRWCDYLKPRRVRGVR
ncbi:MAG: protein-S-isoprenylcysteine O-methyltransferase [Pseudomonadota bacterium]